MWYEPCLVPDVLKDKDVLGGIWAKAVDPSGEVTSGGSQGCHFTQWEEVRSQN